MQVSMRIWKAGRRLPSAKAPGLLTLPRLKNQNDFLTLSEDTRTKKGSDEARMYPSRWRRQRQQNLTWFMKTVAKPNLKPKNPDSQPSTLYAGP